MLGPPPPPVVPVPVPVPPAPIWPMLPPWDAPASTELMPVPPAPVSPPTVIVAVALVTDAPVAVSVAALDEAVFVPSVVGEVVTACSSEPLLAGSPQPPSPNASRGALATGSWRRRISESLRMGSGDVQRNLCFCMAKQ